MNEAGRSQPRADKYGEQIHQLDGITAQKRQQAKVASYKEWESPARGTAPPVGKRPPKPW